VYYAMNVWQEQINEYGHACFYWSTCSTAQK
jgi:hypothetical protein